MKLMWKRIINGKKIQFEADFILSAKINFDNVILSKSEIEKEYLIESVQSIIEEHFFESKKKHEEKKLLNDSEKNEKTKVRNHFRNICFRKKFRTLNEHIDYVANYYGLNSLQVLDYVNEDLPFIKKEVGIK